jgi:hypothetical protein
MQRGQRHDPEHRQSRDRAGEHLRQPTGDRHRDPLVVVLEDRRATAGFVDFEATTKLALPPVIGPIRGTVVLGGGHLGTSIGGDVGACAVHVFTCTGTKLECT